MDHNVASTFKSIDMYKQHSLAMILFESDAGAFNITFSS